MNFFKRLSLTILSCLSMYLLSYFLGIIGFPAFLTSFLSIVLGVIAFSLLLKLFFKKFCSKNHSWLTYTSFALTADVLCDVAIRIVGEISPVVSNIFWDSYETEMLLLKVVYILQVAVRVILMYYFIYVIEMMDLEEFDPCQNSREGKLYSLAMWFGAIVYFAISSFSCIVVCLCNAKSCIITILVIILLMMGVACWAAMVLINFEASFDNSRLDECSWCSGNGKVWKGTKGWLTCDHCGGTGLIGW